MPSLSVLRVYAETMGSRIKVAWTNTSPADGDSAAVEFATDFNEEGGSALIESEPFTYTGIDEDNDLLLGVVRPSPVAHPVRAFVSAGTTPFTEILADGYVDGSDQLSKGVRVPDAMQPFLKLGIRVQEDVQVVPIEELGDTLNVTGAPVGQAQSLISGTTTIFESIEIQPKDGSSIPVVIKGGNQKIGLTSAALTEWRDDNNVVKSRIGRLGTIETGQTIGQFSAFGDAFPVIGFMLGSFRIGPGGASAPDVRLRRTGANEITLDDSAGGRAYFVIHDVLDIDTAAAAPASPSAGKLRLYVTNDGSNHPQMRVKNSAGTVQTLTTFADGA